MFKKLNLLIKIIRNVHDQFFCVYSNMNRIEKLIKQYYYWFNIRKIIKRYIRNYYNYQRIKSFHDELIELFRSLFILVQRWIDISMNFIMKLFDSKKYNVICTIINRLFKKRYYVFYIVDKKNIVVEICVRNFISLRFSNSRVIFILNIKSRQLICKHDLKIHL